MARPIVGFEHLHLHSDRSLLDGFGTPEEYAARWKPRGDYLCISDHGMMAVIPEQIRACEPTHDKDDPYKDKKLNSIFASELYVNPLQIEYDSDKQLKDYIKSLPPDEQKLMRRSYHLLAIAYNDVGYSNLVTLTSLAWTKGFYYRPRVNHQQLIQYKEGIIFTSCCYASEVGQAFDRGGEDEGFRMLEKYMVMFGTDYRLEFMLLDFVKQKPYDAFIIKAHDKYKIPLIVTNDCFVADTQVLTDVGPKSIQDINIGDKVLTHQGRYRPVVFKNERYLNNNEIVYRVVAQLGSYCFEATGNHPVSLDNGELVKVENLKAGDKLVISRSPRAEKSDGFVQTLDLLELLPPLLSRRYYKADETAFVTHRGTDKRNTVRIPRYLPVTNELLSVLGMYIAEGHVYANAEVGFASHVREAKEREILEKYFLKFGIHVNHDLRGENGKATRFTSVIFKLFFEILCGKGASNKHLPPLKLSESQLAILLKAYIAGDGYLREVPFRQLMIPTTSLKLVEQIRAIICSWGIPVVRTERNYRKKSHKYKNKNAKPFRWKTLYIINLSGDKLRNFEKCLNLDFNTDKFDFTVPVKSVFPIDYNLQVYNLQVLEDETYTANGWVVHNCHYCEPGDSKFQRLMLMIQTKRTIADIERKLQEAGEQDLFELQDQNLWMKTEEELNDKWEKDYSDVIPYELFEQAKKNTVEICRMAGNVKLDRSMKLPELPNANERLKEEVIKGFRQKGLPFNKEYQYRLKEEFELIFEKKFSSYFLILKAAVDEARRFTMEIFGTPNAVGPGRGSGVGSLVCYCLGITTVNPIKHGLLFSRFLSKARKDWPDADVDFLPAARDHIKNDWAPKHFGQDKVSNIGSYNTFGIKSSLIDMARVYGKDRNEILGLTTKIGLKDEDGSVMTWDKAQETFPELKKYCEDNSDVAEAAQKLIGRNRSMGKHAGGIVISSVPINKFVPLVRGKGGEVVSAWTQGLHDQDLEPMGFIKYDWLVITNLEQINYACKLIKERYGVKGIWAKEGQEDWSDDNFITDAKAITMANEADLKGIFQFDSEGIRNLVKRAGINGFDDLVAITALYRPGPMGEGQHDEFVARKKGEKSHELHLLLEPILGNTYGVICFQEQCMKIFNVVGDIPLEHCYNLIKAISKKKKEIFGDYKVMFLENGKKNLGWAEEEIEALWKQLEGFAGYAFNLCLSGDSKITLESGEIITIKEIYEGFKNKNPIKVQTLNYIDKITTKEIEGVYDNGPNKIFELELTTGQTIKATENHRFRTDKGWMPLKEILQGDWIAMPRRIVCTIKDFDIPNHEIICLAYFLSEGNTCHPSSLYFYNNDLRLISDFCNNAKYYGDANITINRKLSGNFYVTINSGHKGDHKNYKKSHILEWADRIGIRFKTATEKEFPNFVFQFSDKQIGLLLGRMWEGDGHIRKTIYYSTSSRSLAFQVQSLLLRLGIISTVGTRKFKYNGAYKTGYVVNLHGENYLELFKKYIGVYLVTKQEVLNKIKITGKNYDLIPYSFFDTICHEVKESEIPIKEIASLSGICERTFYRDNCKSGITRQIVKKIGLVINSKVLVDIASSDIYWSRVRDIKSIGIENTYDITVKDTHNFIANDIISHNSHAVAYTYISFMLLVLKVHYPLEFFASILHYESVAEKMKEYKCDAEKHEIKTDALDLNKSRVYFDITDDTIYFGFANVKGIGEGVAERIVANQPYASFSDFLDKFGTDESVIKPLIGLGLFIKDGKPEILYKYYKWYKDIKEKREARKKRFEVTCVRHAQESEVISNTELPHEEKTKKFIEIQKKVDRSVSGYHNKPTIKDPIPPLSEFLMEQSLKEVAGSEQEPDLDEKIIQLFHAPEECEQQFYGFLWHHPLRNSPDYEGNRTFEIFREKGEPINYVEVIIKSAAKQTSKKNKDVNYWLLKAEDVNGEEALIQVWQDEWDRFGPELKAGELVKLKLRPPDKGFSRYTLWSPKKWPKWEYDKLVPKDRTFDFRVVPLRKGEFK